MKTVMQWCVSTVLVVLVLVLVTLPMVPAAEGAPVFACHGIKKPNCRGVFSLFGADLRYNMTGSPAEAEVEAFTKPKTPRSVTWKSLSMKGTIGTTGEITATLDQRHPSTGTILSLGRAEFPATATMRFFLKLNAGGVDLISDTPAVFRGTIHAIPPAPGDALTFAGEPVKYHPAAAPGITFATLKKATVSFATSGPKEP